MERFICIHGHFYQPPRQNPWLEAVEVQDSAAPFHNWNARINAECYAPNAAARILGATGNIEGIVNNYKYISFNFGPTLLSWLEERAPRVHQALVEADQFSLERLGHGNAIAQVYNHIIMPLATRRDKLTQIRWGISDFERRFGRRPQGMWLAETAVDLETLECLAEEGIEFTILAPRQALAIRPGPDEPWAEANGEMETRRPYRVALPGGGGINVFFYDASISQAVAFEGLLKDGAFLADRLRGALDEKPSEPQLVSLATDGESYGHHHRFGEMALAYALRLLEEDSSLSLTNYAAFLAEHPATWEAQIRENSSWSCAHGVERWRSDCGCSIDPGSGHNQKWRAPLREGLDQLKQKLDGLFEQQGGELFSDPWAVLDNYAGTFPLASGQEAWQKLLQSHGAGGLSPEDASRAALIMECQRWGNFMFTSCGWFFDDISGLETVQNLRFAARALQLARALGADPAWEDQLQEVLSQAKSNLPKEGDGKAIWQRRVAPAKVGMERVMAHVAISGVIGGEAPPEKVFCYSLQSKSHHRRRNLGLHLCWGTAKVSHLRAGVEHDLAYAALHIGGLEFSAWVGPSAKADFKGLAQKVEGPLRLSETSSLHEILSGVVGGRHYELGDLFLEQRRRLAREMLADTTRRHREMAENIYEENLEAMLYLQRISVPLPSLFGALARAVLTGRLIEALEHLEKEGAPDALEEPAVQAEALGIGLSSDKLLQALKRALAKEVSSLQADGPGGPAAERALKILDLAESLDLKPDLWEAQNIYAGLLSGTDQKGLASEADELGRRLGFSPEVQNQQGS